MMACPAALPLSPALALYFACGGALVWCLASLPLAVPDRHVQDSDTRKWIVRSKGKDCLNQVLVFKLSEGVPHRSHKNPAAKGFSDSLDPQLDLSQLLS